MTKNHTRPAFFLDRDGTLAEEVGYMNHLSRFQLYPWSAEAIRRIRAEVEGAVVGVGTVLNTADLVCALKAGCEFVVTPGFTPSLLDAGAGCGVPFIPGIATVSEMMTCLERGLTELKFFPAEASGGPATLKAFAGPVPQVSFCPTGGVGLGNLANYLAVPAVKTVGGSWICPDGLISKGDWDGITRLAAEARDLVTSIRNGN